MIGVTLDQAVDRVGTLPRLPGTTLRLISVVNDPKSNVSDIVGVLRYDQTVTTELLRLCNSAAMGVGRPVHSIDDAIKFLGSTKILQLVLAAHTRALLGPEQRGYGLRPAALWKHSVGTALGCQVLARRFKQRPSGLLFTAGLLHDIGKIVLNEAVAAEYATIARRVAKEQMSFLDAEKQVLGFTHAEVGARLAERWELPEAIVRCIRYHHEPRAVQPADLAVDTVHLADALCRSSGIGGGDDSLLYDAEEEVLRRRGLAVADWSVAAAEIVMECKQVESLFAVG